MNANRQLLLHKEKKERARKKGLAQKQKDCQTKCTQGHVKTVPLCEVKSSRNNEIISATDELIHTYIYIYILPHTQAKRLEQAGGR